MSNIEKKLNILVIEDSEDDFFLIKNELNKSSYKMVYTNVCNLNEITGKNDIFFDLVISDYFIPQYDIFAALEYFKTNYETVPFIVFSGAIGEEIVASLLKSGADDFLNKKNINKLLSVVEKKIQESFYKNEQKQLEYLLKVQREWALAVSKTMDMNEIFKISFDAVLRISGMDSGGIYLYDDLTRSFNIVYHHGLTEDFFKKVRSFHITSQEAQIVLKGKPVYYENNNPDFSDDNKIVTEQICSVGVIPIVHENNVIGSINIASHKINEISFRLKENAEYIVNHMGLTIVKARYSNMLKESQQKYKELINGIREGFYEIDKEGVITYANKTFAGIVGLKDETDALGTNLFDYIIQDEKADFIKIFRQAFSSGIFPSLLEIPILNKENMLNIIIELSSIPVLESGRITGARGLISDKTERILAEKEKERLNKELFNKNKELEQLIYVASHDLRSPLVNIIGFSNELGYSIDRIKTLITENTSKDVMLEEVKTIFSTDVEESLYFIKQSVIKIDNLLKGLLRISRLGRNKLEKILIKMNKFFEEILLSFDYLLKTKNIKVTIKELPECRADYFQLNQVFTNIIDNAVKYFDSGKNSFIEISGKREDGSLIYCIHDNGIGISERELERVFEIFYRSAVEISDGEGLGLAIVKKIISMHDGHVWVESEVGVFTKFYIKIPDLEL